MGCAHWFKQFVESTSRTKTTCAVLIKGWALQIQSTFFFFFARGILIYEAIKIDEVIALRTKL